MPQQINLPLTCLQDSISCPNITFLYPFFDQFATVYWPTHPPIWKVKQNRMAENTLKSLKQFFRGKSRPSTYPPPPKHRPTADPPTTCWPTNQPTHHPANSWWEGVKYLIIPAPPLFTFGGRAGYTSKLPPSLERGRDIPRNSRPPSKEGVKQHRKHALLAGGREIPKISRPRGAK